MKLINSYTYTLETIVQTGRSNIRVLSVLARTNSDLLGFLADLIATNRRPLERIEWRVKRMEAAEAEHADDQSVKSQRIVV